MSSLSALLISFSPSTISIPSSRASPPRRTGQSELHRSSRLYARTGVMHDDGGAVDGRDILCMASFNLADCRTTLVIRRCSVSAGVGNFGGIAPGYRTKEGCTTAWVIDTAVRGV